MQAQAGLRQLTARDSLAAVRRLARCESAEGALPLVDGFWPSERDQDAVVLCENLLDSLSVV
jgi:hypothetical protein